MDLIWQKFTDWLKEILIGGITDALSGLFDTVNTRVGEIAGQVGATPQGWNGGIYNMIRSLSDNVILPIAGVILAIVMTMELIQIITDKNNMHGEVDTWFIFKWVFKTACAVLIVSNTWNIVMGVFDVAQSVVNNASGVVVGNVSLDLASSLADLEARLNEMEVWSLLGLWLQATIVKLTMNALNICIRCFLRWRSPVQRKCPKMPNARGLGRLPPAPPFWKSWWPPGLWSAKRAKRR